MHIFSQSLAAAVVAVVETLVRTEVYLFLQAVITSLSQIKVINNQLQNKTQLCSMKKKTCNNHGRHNKSNLQKPAQATWHHQTQTLQYV